MTCDRPKDYMAVFDSFCFFFEKNILHNLFSLAFQFASLIRHLVLRLLLLLNESKGDLLTVLVCVCSSPVDCFLTFGFTFSILDQSHVSSFCFALASLACKLI